MNKIISHLFAFVLVFVSIWLVLSLVPWLEWFKVKEKTSKMEQSLGDLYMKLITDTNEEITDTTFINPLEEIKQRICTGNRIDPETIHLHLVRSSEVNAFALPGNHLVIYSDLIAFCKQPEELAGVMAHEIAHLEKNHIMKKLGKEIGFSALAAMINSGTGGAETLRLLTSTAYDRKMEAEADETGVEYLQKSNINPVGLADFMYRLSVDESDWQKHLTIVSTHPETEERAQKILELAQKETIDYTPALSDEAWVQLRGVNKSIQ